MNRRNRPSFAAIGAYLLLAGGCVETTSPVPVTPIDIALDFCASGQPVWFAYQNAGDPWVRVLPDAEGTFRFEAKRRVAVVYVRENGADFDTEIIGASNTELQAVSGAACLDETGTNQLFGSVTGATGSQLSLITMAFASTYRTASQSAFTLTRVPARPVDLVASRVNVSGTTTQASDRIIIRRNQNLVNGATIPVIDFNSAEAFAPTTTAVNVTGAIAGESTGLYENFFSQQETSHTLFFSQLSGNGSVVVPTIPAAQTAAGDYHDLFVIANATDGIGFRGAERYYRDPPATQTLALGPALASDPTFTTISTSPYVQLRMFLQLAANGRYNRAVNFEFDQQFPAGYTRVHVTVTEGFYNFNPSAWDVTMPDLSNVAGWDNAWGLQAGTPIDWTVTAYFGRPTLLFGAAPQQGEGVQFAGRKSIPDALAAAVAPSALRPRSVVRLR